MARRLDDWYGYSGGWGWRGLFCWSTYNPISKWDWYQVGGRWTNDIPDDMCLVDQLPTDFKPFAFITPDGKWHECGRMRWWAIVSDEKDESAWEQEYQQALTDYPDTLAVLVDCHI